MPKRSKPEKQAKMKELILSAAQTIIARQGVAGLSIRKITQEIGYSAGIVYHYFPDKQAILQTILLTEYQKITQVIQPQKEKVSFAVAFSRACHDYIDLALSHADIYRAVMLDGSPDILEFTAIYSYDSPRPALQLLVSQLQRGMAIGELQPADPLLTAQAIWSALFGLIIRLIIEKDISREHKNQLINSQIRLITKGITK